MAFLLLSSVVLSIVLTVVANVALRSRPVRARADRFALDQLDPGRPVRTQRRVRVYAPWKAMLVGSIILTVVLNLLLRAGR